MKDKVQNLTEKLLELIGIKADLDVSESGEEILVSINPNEKDSGLLIGAHGGTLMAIQSFLNIASREDEGSWKRVVVNIGDWREKQQENLKSLALQAASRAKQTGEPQYLYNLNAAQRREIHVSLKEDEGVTTESAGEGLDRYLIVKAV